MKSLVLFLLSAGFACADYPSRVAAYVLSHGGTLGSDGLSFVSDASGYRILGWPYSFPKPTEANLGTDEQAATILMNHRQLGKPVELKTAENGFILLCEALSGNKTKLGFGEIRTIIKNLQATDPTGAIALSVELLAIDAELKRIGGNKWWDTVAWHPEIVE